MKSMKCIIKKHSHTEIFLAVLMQDILVLRHELAIASNISNTIHSMHKSNISLIYTVS